jgi:hypothetical protein
VSKAGGLHAGIYGALRSAALQPVTAWFRKGRLLNRNSELRHGAVKLADENGRRQLKLLRKFKIHVQPCWLAYGDEDKAPEWVQEKPLSERDNV